MSFKKRISSVVLRTAEKRLAGVKAIDPALDFGNGVSVTAFEQMITDLKALLEAYNTKLGTIDDDANAIDAAEEALSFFNRRMLAAVGTLYGFDSSEYEVAGGTRRSDIKHKNQKPLDDEESTTQGGQDEG